MISVFIYCNFIKLISHTINMKIIGMDLAHENAKKKSFYQLLSKTLAYPKKFFALRAFANSKPYVLQIAVLAPQIHFCHFFVLVFWILIKNRSFCITLQPKKKFRSLRDHWKSKITNYCRKPWHTKITKKSRFTN